MVLEHRAMDGWRDGNPEPALAVFDPEVTYFHVMTEKRLDGLAAVKELFEKYRGMPLFESYEILEPRVQAAGDVAVLTYRFVRHARGEAGQFNVTQVYQRKKEGWRVIHSHFSARTIQP